MTVVSGAFRRGPRRGRLATLLAVTMVLSACASSSPSARPSAQPPPSSLGPVRVGSWSIDRVSTDNRAQPAVTLDGLSHLDAGHGSWVTYGSRQAGPTSRWTPAVWESTNARTWEPSAVAGAAAGGAVTAVGSTRGLDVLGGTIGQGTQVVPVMWWSTDGVRWSGPVRLPVPDHANDVAVNAITSGPHGWVAVGGPHDHVGTTSPVWRSDDGRTWRLATQPARLAAGAHGLPPASLVSVVATAGHYYAVESSTPIVTSDTEEVQGVVPAIWTSADGDHWRRQELGRTAGMAQSVVATPSGLVVSLPGTFDAASLDGTHWSSVQTANGKEPTGQLLVVDGTVVGVDYDSSSWGSGDDQVDIESGNPSKASDGLTVTGSDVGLPDGLQSDGQNGTQVLAGTDGHRLIVGDGQRHHWDIWVGDTDGSWTAMDTSTIPGPRRDQADSIEGLAADGRVAVAVGATVERDPDSGGSGTPSQARIWYSSDRRTWHRATVPPGVANLAAVTRAGAGFVAVGQDADDRPPSTVLLRAGTSGAEPVVLRSVDGRTWIRAASGASTGLGGFIPTAITSTADGLVMAGADLQGGPTIWTSSNGANWSPVALPSAEGSVQWRGLCATQGEVVVVGVEPGSDQPDDGQSDPDTAGQDAPALLISSDDQHWQAPAQDLALPDRSDGGRLNACTFGAGSQLVAVGTSDQANGDEVAMSLTQPDPTARPTTALMDGSEPPFDGQLVRAVAWGGGTFLAGGDSGELDPAEADPAIWSSADGRTWHRLEEPVAILDDPLASDLDAATPFGSGVVLAGNDADAAAALTTPAG